MLEMLAHTEGLIEENNISGENKSNESDSSTKNILYPPYQALSDIEKGVKSGIYYRGKIRVDKNFFQWKQILLYDHQKWVSMRKLMVLARNRAVDGDLVAVRILSEEEEHINEKEKRWMWTVKQYNLKCGTNMGIMMIATTTMF